MKSILYVTDLYYKAKGRNYYEEDLYITSHLKDHFQVLICHPLQVLDFLEVADMIIIRNSGSVIHYKDYFYKFVDVVREQNITTFNSMDGKADMQGKQYLVELTKEYYPVIPTIDSLENLARLGTPAQYVLKPKFGADSIGMKIVAKDAIKTHDLTDYLIQPFVPFSYEVSFYYLNNEFQYALYAPNKGKRWELKEYIPNDTDLYFAKKFIYWNNMDNGIQRVDACRLPDGSLSLIELEDLNPFLSLDKLNDTQRKKFIDNFIATIAQQDEFVIATGDE